MAALAETVIAWPGLIGRRLIWCDELGLGYYPVANAAAPYDAAYFARYEAMADTEMGRALNAARLALVARYWSGDLVDIGIGSGAFMEARIRTWGYDINPVALDYLRRRKRLWNPRHEPCPAVSMWDSLEHIRDFPALLNNVTHWVFVSVPVFHSAAHAHRSRHYRPDEHCWYFTSNGLIAVMKQLGFVMHEANFAETLLGRDGIASFAFHRADA